MIKPYIAEHHLRGSDLWRDHFAASASTRSANFEQVSEVSRKANSEHDPPNSIVEIANAQALEAGGIPEESRSPEMNPIVVKM
jgi:hypothetical protein